MRYFDDDWLFVAWVVQVVAASQRDLLGRAAYPGTGGLLGDKRSAKMR
jgi:hypothetical protein